MNDDTITVNGGGGDDSRSDNEKHDGSGQNSNGSSVNLSVYPEAQVIAVLAAPMNITLIGEGWGFTLLTSQTITSALQAGLSTLGTMALEAAPYLGRMAGVVVGSLIPSKIAPDDPKFMARIVNALPATTVTDVPMIQLPTQPSVLAKMQVEDTVEDELQKIVVVSSPTFPVSVPVVNAVPTTRTNVFTAQIVPSMPPVHIKMEKSTTLVNSVPAIGITEVKNAPVKPVERGTGSSTSDAFIHFPTPSGFQPIYVSITTVLTVEQIKKQEEEAKRRQAQWDARHPLEVAERELAEKEKILAQAELDILNREKARKDAENTPEALVIVDPVSHPLTYTKDVRFVTSIYNGTIQLSFTIETRDTLNQLLSQGGGMIAGESVEAPTYAGFQVAQTIQKGLMEIVEEMRQLILDGQKRIIEAQNALVVAIEGRNKAEDEKNKSEKNRDQVKEENKNKPTSYTLDDKIKVQMGERGWTEQDVKDVVGKGQNGISSDQRRPNKTPPDFLGRNDPASVYGMPGKYVVINDRTGEITQVSGKNDPHWIDDGRIVWEKK